MDFEKKLKELEFIVKQMEAGISLERGIELFEQGIVLSKDCFKSLDESKSRIEKIKKEMDELLSNGRKSDEL